jgi:hypothetical protein
MATVRELEAKLAELRAYNRRRREAHEARLRMRSKPQCLADATRHHPNGEKVCKRCRLSLPFACFEVRSSQDDGLSFACNDCWAERSA